MDKIKNIEELLNKLSQKKKISKVDIKDLADLDFFRKEKTETNKKLAQYKVDLDHLFFISYERINTSEKSIENGIKDYFNNACEKLLKELTKDIPNGDFSKIESYEMFVEERDVSFLDEPSEYRKYIFFNVTYMPENSMRKQTDDEVIQSLKTKLEQLRSEKKTA